MNTLLALWRLNRISFSRSKPPSILYEYVGYVKSESKPNTIYHTIVRVYVNNYKLKLCSFTCECPYFTFKGKCKHIKALYETVKKDIINRLAYDIPLSLDGDIA
ncbi:MAG: SWIM zinc finger family protein [Acidilobaceae archaeon]